MPWPRVLLIEERNDGVFLDRFADDGSSAGDTWHVDVAEAKAQAEAEYGGMLTEWNPVPGALTGREAVAFALARVRSADDQ